MYVQVYTCTGHLLESMWIWKSEEMSNCCNEKTYTNCVCDDNKLEVYRFYRIHCLLHFFFSTSYHIDITAKQI